MFWSKSIPQERQELAHADRSSIGNVLLELGLIKPKTLEEAVSAQQSDQYLGQILVQTGVITEEELKDALTRQRIMRGQAKPKEATSYFMAQSQKAAKEVTSGFDDLTRMSNVLVDKLNKR